MKLEPPDWVQVEYWKEQAGLDPSQRAAVELQVQRNAILARREAVIS